jgi:hypothetical protein
MRIFLAAFITLCSFLHQAHAKAYFQTKQEMIERAEAIAVIEISAAQDSDVKGTTWTYQTKGKAKVVQTLKGTLPDEFALYGSETFICASCPIVNGRFVAFLRKDGDLWAGSNWHLSLRPIKGGMVDWFVAEDNRREMKPAALASVLAEIQRQIARKQIQP